MEDMSSTSEVFDSTNIQAAKAGIWFTIANVVQKGAAFIYIPLYTRLVPTTEYGQWSLWQSWYQMLLILSSLNLHSAVYNNGMLKYKSSDRRDKYTSSMIGLTFVTSFFVVVIFSLLHIYFNNIIKLNNTLVILLAAQLIFAPPFNYWMARARYEYKYHAVLIVITLISVITPALALLLIKIHGPSADSITIGYVLPNSLLGLLFCIAALKKTGLQAYDKADWLYALNFNLPLVPYYFANVVLGQIDRVMIAGFCSESDAAVYALAYQVSLALNILIAGINSAFVPWLYSKLENDDQRSVSNALTILSVFIGLSSVVLVAAAPELLAVLGPSEYRDAVWIIPPVVLGTFAVFYQTCFCNVEFYYAETKSIAILSIIVAIVNVFLNYLLIRLYGYYAAGWTTFICYILLTLGHYYLMRRAVFIHSNKGVPANPQILSFIFIVISIICILIMFIYEYIFLRFAMILITCIAALYISKNKLNVLRR